MKFEQYIIKNHPEFFDEGILDSLAKNKGVRKAVMMGGLAAAGFGLGSKMNNSKGPETERPAASQRLSGTYEGGIRTSDEQGRPIKLSQQDQKHVDTVRGIRKRMSGGEGGSGNYQKKSVSSSDSAEFFKSKSKSAF